MSDYSIGYNAGLHAAKAELLEQWRFTKAVEELEATLAPYSTDRLAKLCERTQAWRSVAAIQALIDERDGDPEEKTEQAAGGL